MSEKYRLGVYEKAMPDSFELSQKLELAKEAGFDFVELSIDESDDRLARLERPKKDWLELLQQMNREDFRFETLCLSGHRKYPMGSKDPEIRQRSMDIFYKSVDLARFLNIPVIQLAGYDVYYEDSTPESKDLFMENLHLAVEYAAKHCQMLSFETMETEFMDTTAKALDICRQIDSPFLQIYPDVGNLQNAAVKYDFAIEEDLKKGKGHILAAHLKETKPGLYRNMFFGDPSGHTKYVDALKELLSQNVKRFTAEFWNLGSNNYSQELKKASEFLRDKISLACAAIQDI